MGGSNGGGTGGLENADTHPFLELSHDSLAKFPTKQLVNPLRDNPTRLGLRFASGNAGHYIRFSPGENEFLAVHSGPHGPEHRPARVDMRNIKLLQKECELIEPVTLDNSPFVTPEIRGD